MRSGVSVLLGVTLVWGTMWGGGSAEAQVDTKIDRIELRVMVNPSKPQSPKFASTGPTTLKTTVRDESGEPISGLQKRDFSIHRGRSQGEILRVTPIDEIKEIGRRIVLLIDNSSSMEASRSDVINDLNTLISGFGPNTSVAVVLFGDEAYRSSLIEYKGEPLHVKPKWFTANKGQLMHYLRSEFFRAELSNHTYVFEQVLAGRKLLEASILRNSQDAAIVLSDGDDNASLVSRAELEALPWSASAPFYTIDYASLGSSDFLSWLAKRTGGRHFKAGDVSQLKEVFRQISQRIVTGGYEIEYRFKPGARGDPSLRAPGLNLSDSSRFLRNVDTLTVEEQIVRQQFPLLTYLFFEPGQTEVSPRYHVFTAADESARFDEKVIPGDAIEHYYHVLNVIGARLRANPLSMVSVVGCSDNGANDNAVPRIGDQRAETVQDYLVRIWGIDPQRIRVSGRGLPEIPSSTSVPEGVAENRRVEILSTDWEIMKPLSFETRELRVDPDTLFMGMRFTLDGVLTRWKLPVYAGGKLWREFTDTTGPDVEVCWDLRGPNGEFPRSSLRYEWSVEDSSGEETVVHRAALPVKLLTVERKKVENLADMEIERFNLILFEFNKADLGSRNERILQLVVPGIKPESNVTVAGYTDVIGEERANQLLSEQRARAVYGRLRDIGTPCRSMESIGYGEALRLFSNLLPEGRFYNRTVQITIKTPVRPE